MADDEKKIPDGPDVAFLGPPEPGGGVHILRHRPNHTLEAGVLRPLQEGKPLYGEVVSLERREDGPGFAIKTVEMSGPAMVNSQAYRDGWDNIFGKKTKPAEA